MDTASCECSGASSSSTFDLEEDDLKEWSRPLIRRGLANLSRESQSERESAQTAYLPIGSLDGTH